MSEAHAANSDPEAEAYFEGLSRGVILLQRCSSCEQFQFPPRVHCSRCPGRELAWAEAGGAGTVYAKTVNRRAPEPAFEPLVPYVTALVDLDARVRVLARADCPPGDVVTGMRVTVIADPAPLVAPGLLFRPDASPDGSAP